MFVVRENLASNDELVRQKTVSNVIVLGKSPTTLLEKNAAAIIGHSTINPITQAKVYRVIDEIFEIITSKADLSNEIIKDKIREMIRPVKLQIGDTIRLTRKKPVLTLQPEKIPDYNGILETEISSNANLAEFEYLCFKNHIKYRYMTNTNFATYMYQNLLYYLEVGANVDACLENCNDQWQSRFATLLANTSFSKDVAMEAFYEDRVYYRNEYHDTSFVPKYDVRAIVPQEPINYDVNDADLIRYYNEMNERTTHYVPVDKMAIFLTFPFKNGHYIQPNGKVVYLNLEKYRCRRSSRIVIQDLCNTFAVESAVDNAARIVSFDNAVYHAVNANDLREQAMALLILRRMVGDTITVENHQIHIPSELNILSWMHFSCSKTNVVLPPVYESTSMESSKMLVRDIANSCYSALGASIICSGYGIPEVDMGAVYQTLHTDAEKYVFFTMVLQEYPLAIYANARKRLSPKFGHNTIDLSAHKPFTRMYSNTTIAQRLDMLSEPLLRPSDVNNEITLCNPYKCTEMYEFVHPQLNELVRTGDVDLNRVQLANFIALVI